MADAGGGGFGFADGGGGNFDFNFDDDMLLDPIALGGDVEACPMLVPTTGDSGDGGKPAGSNGEDLLDWSAFLSNEDINPRNSVTGVLPPETSTSSAAPAPPRDYNLDCSGCHVLREVEHSNGFEAMKLCIHGGAGVFYHATVDMQRVISDAPVPAPAHHFCIDFRERSYEGVKQYLMEYAAQRTAGGFAVVQDSISAAIAAFNDALYTTMACNSSHVVGDAHNIPVLTAAAAARTTTRRRINNGASSSGGGGELSQPAPSASGRPSQARSNTTNVQQPFQPAARTALAIQRERTSKLQLHDIAPYFDLSIGMAASKLDICVTSLKCICRKHGISRWPYRKVKSIDKQIARLQRSGNGDAIRKEIERLSASRRRIIAGDLE